MRSVTVKLPFLYGLCKRDFIQWVERDNDQLPMEYWEEYLTVTAAPWGAEEVFQRYSGAEPVNQFLLCWPDRMAEVKLPWDWRLTADRWLSSEKSSCTPDNSRERIPSPGWFSVCFLTLSGPSAAPAPGGRRSWR